MTIWKYELYYGETAVNIPRGGTVLSAQVQRENVCIWVMVDERAELEIRSFRVYGTGHPVDATLRHTFIGTVQMGGVLVWHVFEVLP